MGVSKQPKPFNAIKRSLGQSHNVQLNVEITSLRFARETTQWIRTDFFKARRLVASVNKAWCHRGCQPSCPASHLYVHPHPQPQRSTAIWDWSAPNSMVVLVGLMLCVVFSTLPVCCTLPWQVSTRPDRRQQHHKVTAATIVGLPFLLSLQNQ